MSMNTDHPIATVTVADQSEADARLPGSMPCHLRIEDMAGPIDLFQVGGSWDVLHGWKPDVGPEGVNTSCILSVTVSGGERPIHPAWIRSIRDQCAAAGVSFTFLSWGQWFPWRGESAAVDGMLDSGRKPTVLKVDQQTGNVYAVKPKHVDFATWIGYRFCSVIRVGRERSGRTLDGKIHDGMTKGVDGGI